MMTLPSADRDRLMLLASLRRSPVALVAFCLSLPASGPCVRSLAFGGRLGSASRSLHERFGIRVLGFGFQVSGLGSMATNRCLVSGFGFRVSIPGSTGCLPSASRSLRQAFRVLGFGSRVYGNNPLAVWSPVFGFRVSGGRYGGPGVVEGSFGVGAEANHTLTFFLTMIHICERKIIPLRTGPPRYRKNTPSPV